MLDAGGTPVLHNCINIDAQPFVQNLGTAHVRASLPVRFACMPVLDQLHSGRWGGTPMQHLHADT